MTQLQAHRGVSSEYPENTIVAFQASVDQGYGVIECDFKYTADKKFVVLHDKTVNRTARTRTGEVLSEPTSIFDLTLEEARALEYGSWMDPKFFGEPIPTLPELMDFARRTQIPLKIDNCWEHFPDEMQELLLKELAEAGSDAQLGFTCAQPENIARVTAMFPNCTIHYDGGDLSEERLATVAALAKGHKLIIWVCYENDLTHWFKGTKASDAVCRRVKQYGELGVWILSEKEELKPAIQQFHADLIETTGHIKPWWLTDEI